MVVLNRLADWLVGLGLLLLVLAVSLYFQKFNHGGAASNFPLKTNLAERNLAIAKALRDGQSEYSFTTNFIPGIGFINDPEVYLKQWEEEAKQGFETE